MSENEMMKRVAKAICCPNGKCHVEAIKKREDGKYLTDLPCYALGPDVQESALAAIKAMRAPTSGMLKACSRALAEYIRSVPVADRKWKQRMTFGGVRGYKISPNEKAQCRWLAMVNAALNGD